MKIRNKRITHTFLEINTLLYYNTTSLHILILFIKKIAKLIIFVNDEF